MLVKPEEEKKGSKTHRTPFLFSKPVLTIFASQLLNIPLILIHVTLLFPRRPQNLNTDTMSNHRPGAQRERYTTLPHPVKKRVGAEGERKLGMWLSSFLNGSQANQSDWLRPSVGFVSLHSGCRDAHTPRRKSNHFCLPSSCCCENSIHCCSISDHLVSRQTMFATCTHLFSLVFFYFFYLEQLEFLNKGKCAKFFSTNLKSFQMGCWRDERV